MQKPEDMTREELIAEVHRLRGPRARFPLAAGLPIDLLREHAAAITEDVGCVCEIPVGRLEAIAASLPDLVRPQEVQWVVNSLGELGVFAGGEYQFLYKGHSIIYRETENEGGPRRVRPVYKREFGETCHPDGQYRDGYLVSPYTFGDESDWIDLPLSQSPDAT